MEYVREIFAKRLQSLMTDKGLTQTDLANKVGTSRQSISLYVNGDRNPDIAVLRKISDALEVSADYLIGITDAPTKDFNLENASEYTGLSIGAVKELHKICNEETKKLILDDGFSADDYDMQLHFTEISSKIITHSNFYTILSEIDNCKDIINTEFEDEDDVYSPFKKSKFFIAPKLNKDDYIRILKQNIKDMFGEIVNSIIDSKK